MKVASISEKIGEVKNAIATYDELNTFKPYNLTSLCKAHKLLMDDLVSNADKLRTTSVGIVKGSQNSKCLLEDLGKSTLLKSSFPKYQYVSLEDPDIRLFA